MTMTGTPSGILSVEGTLQPRQTHARDDETLEKVKAMMLQIAAGARFERLGAIVQEHLFTGGKRLRARLALESAVALGGSADDTISWAAACELLHNATLVHDDLQDADPMRRGHFTVWMRHGHAQAINAGDLMLMLPFLAVEELDADDQTRWHLARAIARRAEQTVRGQSLEMTLLSSGMLDWESYAAAARGKTSALMALPVHGAALLVGRAPEEAERLSEPFCDLGLLFQIQDDVVDLFGDKGRGERGGDLREGRVSALVAEHLRLHPTETRRTVDLLETPRDQTSHDAIEAMADRIEEGGALAAVLDRITGIAHSIRDAEVLAGEPELRRVAGALIERSLAPVRHLMEKTL